MNRFVDSKKNTYVITRNYLEVLNTDNIRVFKKNINTMNKYSDGGTIEFVFEDNSKFQIPETQYISSEQRGYNALYIDNTFNRTVLSNA
jgi:hypothetical protein